MRYLHRHLCLLANGYCFINRFRNVISLVTDMRGIYSTVFCRSTGQSNNFFSICIGARYIDQPRGNSHGTISHPLFNQRFHTLLLLRCRLALTFPHHRPAHRIMTDQRSDVQRNLNAVNLPEIVSDIGV